MDSSLNVQKVTSYWVETSDKDYKVMEDLFLDKHYSWSLFMGHIVIEKLLKAYIVKNTAKHAPFSHDLRKLAMLTGANFPENYLSWLDTITTFNLNARYDSYKQEFYKKCTSQFTSEWVTNIKQLRQWIKKQL